MAAIKRRNCAITALVALGLVGCAEENQEEVLSLIEENEEVSTALVRATSSAEFENYLKQGLVDSTTYTESFGAPVAMEAQEESFSTTTVAAASDSSSDAVSSTNVQVIGVDEGDLVKNDGSYLFVAKQPEYIYSIDPIPEPLLVEGGVVSSAASVDLLRSSPVTMPPSERLPATVRLFEMQADPADSRLVNEIELSDEKLTHINSLYLAQNEGGEGDLLVVLGQAQQSWSWDVWADPWYWQSGEVSVSGYDVADPQQVDQAFKLDIEGHMLTSRRIDDTLYLVTRHTPYVPGFVAYPYEESQREANQQLLENTTVESLLPKVRIDDAEPEPLVLPENCFLPHTEARNNAYPSLITITAINLRNPREQASTCYGGNSYNFYASTENLYVTRNDYYYPAVEVDATTSSVRSQAVERTVIHKFALSAEGAKYQASGVVPGTVRSSHPSFMMSERGEEFNIVTSKSWGRDIEHQLFVLAQDGRRLIELSHLPNKKRPEPIGKPGERLYAARFLGDMVYLVTFRQIDPLYAVDLSDSRDPKIVGELELPGYSGYLHPVAEDKLLGIGMDATSTGRLNGIKVSLFDVFDIENPQEINSIVIGDQGTNSSALYDHHALTYLIGRGEAADRFTLPVSKYEYDSTGVTSWPQWSHTGLYLFEIEESLAHVGTLVADQSSDDRYDRVGTWNDRAVIQGNAVHYVHDSEVISADWDAVLP